MDEVRFTRIISDVAGCSLVSAVAAEVYTKTFGDVGCCGGSAAAESYPPSRIGNLKISRIAWNFSILWHANPGSRGRPFRFTPHRGADLSMSYGARHQLAQFLPL